MSFEHLQLVHGSLKVVTADGLQKIGNAVDTKGLKGIFVVGCGEDDGTCDVCLTEDVEGRAVGKMDVHEHQFGHGVRPEPFYSPCDAVGLADDFEVGIHLLHGSFQVSQSGFLVFNQ